MFSVKVEVQWRAAHRLMDYVGKCSNLHGESYVATFYYQGEDLDSSGILLDFGPTKREIRTWIDENLDHTSMLRKDDPLVGILLSEKSNVFTMKENPTAENIAKMLFEQFKHSINRTGVILTKVKVRESFPDSEAYYIPLK